ncbi:hypothetical protein ACFVY9_22005 [Streptomyces sp. NPDC059544]|uniref:hypothetical protein n=1 Tax=Streptomyces sp. NPDC059544 TaxID=3346861 RepID=UPI0036B10A4A
MLPGGPSLHFNEAPEPKSAKNRLHLCLRPDTLRDTGRPAAEAGRPPGRRCPQAGRPGAGHSRRHGRQRDLSAADGRCIDDR